MGHYRNVGRYREELVPLLERDLARDGLPQPSGIGTYVAADGQSWYAERQAITGHWFAIGAAGPAARSVALRWPPQAVGPSGRRRVGPVRRRRELGELGVNPRLPRARVRTPHRRDRVGPCYRATGVRRSGAP